MKLAIMEASSEELSAEEGPICIVYENEILFVRLACDERKLKDEGFSKKPLCSTCRNQFNQIKWQLLIIKEGDGVYGCHR